MKIGSRTVILCLRGKLIYSHVFCVSVSMWVKFGAGDVHRNVLSECKFENQLCESRTLLGGVSEFLSILSTFIV